MPRDSVVALTQEPQDNEPLAALLSDHGITSLSYPCIATEIKPYAGGELPDELLGGRTLRDFGVLAFSSKRGVSGMALAREQLLVAQPMLACVGEATAAEAERVLGLSCKIIPQEQTGAGMAQAIIARLEPARPVLHPRGNKTTGEFVRILTEHGWEVCELEVYANHAPDLEPLRHGAISLAVFASPSAASCFFAANTQLKSTLRCVAIGSVTGQALRELRAKHITEAAEPSHAGLVNKVLEVIDQEIKHDTEH